MCLFFSRLWRPGLMLLCCLPGVLLAGEKNQPFRYALPVSVIQLMSSESDFEPFARRVYRDVDDALRAPPSDTARLKLLLGLRVHLALHFRDDQAALDAAERIRALQNEPGEKALAGLTTRAIVAAHHDRAAFEQEFVRLLRSLPRSPQIRTALEKAREKIAAITEPNLREEVRSRIAPAIQPGEPLTLEQADQVIRARHRLQDILPIRDALLRAYDTALAAQQERSFP